MIRTILYTTLYVRNEYVITRHNMPIIYAYIAYVIFFFFFRKCTKTFKHGYNWIYLNNLIFMEN